MKFFKIIKFLFLLFMFLLTTYSIKSDSLLQTEDFIVKKFAENMKDIQSFKFIINENGYKEDKTGHYGHNLKTKGLANLEENYLKTKKTGVIRYNYGVSENTVDEEQTLRKNQLIYSYPGESPIEEKNLYMVELKKMELANFINHPILFLQDSRTKIKIEENESHFILKCEIDDDYYKEIINRDIQEVTTNEEAKQNYKNLMEIEYHNNVVTVYYINKKTYLLEKQSSITEYRIVDSKIVHREYNKKDIFFDNIKRYSAKENKTWREKIKEYISIN